jgi:hypothetical protein
MAKLTKAGRSKIKTKNFAGPGRSFPVEDKKHAKAAILDAPAAVRAGSITPMQKAMIDRKARAKLGKGK